VAAQESGGAAVAGPTAYVRDLLDGLGFAPEERREGELRLTRCPLLEAALEEPTVVCNVHRGLVLGALEERGVEGAEVELLPFAERGACLLRVRA